jgi:opacity protein-like surface antigen
MFLRLLKRSTRTRLIRLGLATAVTLSLSGLAAAQQYEGHRWSANIGGGYTPLLGALNKRLDNGYNITFGAGYNVSSRFSLGAQVMYNGLGVSSGLLREVAVPGGNARIWSVTVDPKLTFAPRHRVTPYVVGGVGYYRRVVEFTQPTTIPVTFFDPFFGFFPTVLPADQVIGRVIRDGIGGNAGLGFQVPVGERGVKIFAEARYHYASGGGIPTRMLPFTIGVRF